MRPNPVKTALKNGQPSVGTWLSLGSITAARFMARSGFAWLTTDIEHSLVDWETATHMFATIADAGCTALARVPANRHDHIKRVLDNGAHGVVVPMVNSRQEALDAVATCKKHKVAPGLPTGSADEALARIEEGWQFIAITSELKMMLNGTAQEVSKLGKAAGDMAKY